jgi:DNA modification methylase
MILSMPRRKSLVADDRQYRVRTVAEAKQITQSWLEEADLRNAIKLGLPEIDDRHHIWRVPLRSLNRMQVGEIVIDAYTTEIDSSKSTNIEVIEARLLKKTKAENQKLPPPVHEYMDTPLRDTIALGDCIELIDDLPANSIDLIFTSPPYFNARPEYSEYEEYDEYLLRMRQVISRSHRVLKDGRFLVINTSPVLIRRASRNEASRRIAVPFDLHAILIKEGFEFIDDIIWVKPEGAGWATGRGRRFAADRNPLQYKAVPVTEYVMVYRKEPSQLIDWHIRSHPDQKIVAESKIGDDYEKTNIWRINPSTNSGHPAAFPMELAKKVISYYSFKGDVVMDPFAGSGTTGAAAAQLDRRFVLFEINPEYIALIHENTQRWKDVSSETILSGFTPKPAAMSLF